MNQLCRCILVFAVCGTAAAADKPNILVIYLDDMGWAQPGCYGGRLAPTPHMDAIAANGVRFTDGYVTACVCGPSRVGLMTGRYQARSGHDANTNRPGTELALSETTFAQRLKEGGYRTGIVGKWHLGSAKTEFLPVSRGFDFSVGSVGNLGEGRGPTFYRDAQLLNEFPETPITSPGYAREACSFIEREQKSPWFLCLSFNTVHAPHVASDKWLKKFDQLPKREQQYAAAIGEVDESIGSVMDQLRALDLEENTLVFLISDNGGAAPQAEMGGLRGRKWSLWEGGIRVTWLMQWKNHIPAGLTVNEPVIQLDVLPTVLAAADLPMKSEWQLDGVDLLPLVQGQTKSLDRTLYWRFGVQYAIRHGDWKLVKASKAMEPMLVNLSRDRAESQDLSAAEPEKAKSLLAKWETWNSQMQAPRWEDRRWDGDEVRKANKRKKKMRK